VLVWFDAQTQQQLGATVFSQTDLFDACFSGDGKVILAIGFRRYWVKSRATKSAIATDVRLFALDARTGKRLYTKVVNTWANNFAVSPNGKWFAYPILEGSQQTGKRFLGIFEVKTGREVQRTQDFSPAAWSPDSRTLYLDGFSLWRLQLQNDGNWKLDKENSN
jgi:tricorn protease-like protein